MFFMSVGAVLCGLFFTVAVFVDVKEINQLIYNNTCYNQNISTLYLCINKDSRYPAHFSNWSIVFFIHKRYLLIPFTFTGVSSKCLFI